MTRAIPQKKAVEEVPTRSYEVLSRRCVYGAVGEVVQLQLTEGQELCMIEAGTLKRAEPPTPLRTRPVVADKERKATNG